VPTDTPILSIVIWLPILGGLAVLLLGDARAALARQLALGVSILSFLASLPPARLVHEVAEVAPYVD
jgi:NADH-quinone oxidoreductase subunit M